MTNSDGESPMIISPTTNTGPDVVWLGTLEYPKQECCTLERALVYRKRYNFYNKLVSILKEFDDIRHECDLSISAYRLLDRVDKLLMEIEMSDAKPEELA